MTRPRGPITSAIATWERARRAAELARVRFKTAHPLAAARQALQVLDADPPKPRRRRQGRPTTNARRDCIIGALAHINTFADGEIVERPSPSEIAHYLEQVTGEQVDARTVANALHRLVERGWFARTLFPDETPIRSHSRRS